ncbi:stromal cell-derived factor 2 precursor-like protein [Schistosoma mansoni]|uniref:stromal cell-derived factor 2 precursor-like protein n=1 Tax=Schistosoma mansoni TaxID=6183 RepID=UPI00022C84C9|nr:stromal cell-derived factor 2 precursor-like protein [Schistosoma mansoni]|eukprot:XP_018644739.1 stromal cell-derived factor 2 precursor-like protein [Schistosoma mansoni]
MFLVFALSFFIVFIKESTSQQGTVTCGSVLKLVNTDFNARLHSHEVQYGSGSGQQSVTAVSDEMDTNSYWQVCDDWQIICDGVYWKQSSNIRLKHISTEGYLHLSGKRYSRPISGQYEVSSTPKLTNAITWTTTEGVYIDPIDFLNKSTYLHDEF